MITQKAGTLASMSAGEMAPSRAPGFAPAGMKASGVGFERHFHAGMAWLFVIVAITGFAPRSFAIVTGKMAVPPLVVHLHAAVMASWVVLLAIQATLSLRGRMDLHRKWGLASLVVAPLVLTNSPGATVRCTPICCCYWCRRCCMTCSGSGGFIECGCGALP